MPRKAGLELREQRNVDLRFDAVEESRLAMKQYAEREYQEATAAKRALPPSQQLERRTAVHAP